MALQIIGAGLPRTGTASLKMALERLLDGPCYHMLEFFAHPEHAPVWRDAFRGDLPDWQEFLAGYRAGVDAPLSEFWRPLADAFPNAPVLLSHRADADVWYASMDATVLAQARRTRAANAAGGDGPADSTPGPSWLKDATPSDRRAFGETFAAMFSHNAVGPLDDPEASKAIYEQRLSDVRAAIPAERLVEWQPGDGWEPLCRALGLDVPDEPFPHENTTEQFISRAEAR